MNGGYRVSAIGEPCVRPLRGDDTFTYIFFDSVLMFVAACSTLMTGGLQCFVKRFATPQRLP
ncbi:hypothetical protein EMIT0347P_120093 [Pseudomonas sp. IT-347P]